MGALFHSNAIRRFGIAMAGTLCGLATAWLITPATFG
jgi:hypothetical protein